MTSKKTRKPKAIPPARTLKIPPSDYQPSRAELREEMDMPRLSLKRVRDAFFRPFQFEKEGG